jgi:hypothetical protein
VAHYFTSTTFKLSIQTSHGAAGARQLKTQTPAAIQTVSGREHAEAFLTGSILRFQRVEREEAH